jgi:hypothetical protein
MDIRQARAWLPRDAYSVQLVMDATRRRNTACSAEVRDPPKAAPQRLIVWRSVRFP